MKTEKQNSSGHNARNGSFNIPAPFIIHEDAGHSWLEVPFSLLKLLGIELDISGYSHRSGDTAYLEEDLDAPTFINAWLTLIDWDKARDAFPKDRFQRRYDGTFSFIRQLPRYRV